MSGIIGVRVHYVSYGTPGGEYTSQCRAAIVTEVEEGGSLKLCVLNPKGIFFDSCWPSTDLQKGGTFHFMSAHGRVEAEWADLD